MSNLLFSDYSYRIQDPLLQIQFYFIPYMHVVLFSSLLSLNGFLQTQMLCVVLTKQLDDSLYLNTFSYVSTNCQSVGQCLYCTTERMVRILMSH